jgi:hypothetical protein
MLERGIRDYMQAARQRYQNDPEDVIEYRLCTQTAIREAGKLRDWYSQVAPEYLQRSVESVDALIKELNSDKERFESVTRSNRHLQD